MTEPNCSIPFCENKVGRNKSIRCSDMHNTCNQCFFSYLKSEMDKFEGSRGADYMDYCQGFKIICPKSFCRKVLDNGKIMEKILMKRSLVKVYYRLSLAEAKREGKQEGLEQSSTSSTTMNEAEVFEKSLKCVYGDQTRGLYTCRNCMYGPVQLNGCSDLAAHHNERTEDYIYRVSNSCPACGHFELDISDWDPWNGKVHIPTEEELEEVKKNKLIQRITYYTEDGDPYWYDENGNTYYYDDHNERVYFNYTKDGDIYFYDENRNTYYYNDHGEVVYFDLDTGEVNLLEEKTENEKKDKTHRVESSSEEQDTED